VALNQLYRAHSNAICTVDDDAFTRLNYDSGDAGQGTRTTVNTPKGVLAGSVACLKGSSLIGNPDGVLTAPLPVGLFLNDANGYEWQNQPGVASDKVTFACGAGSTHAVDIYETKTKAGVALAAYAAGDALYCSTHGFLTKEAPTGGNGFNTRLIGYVMQPPTGTDPFMIVQLAI
jgi:hypothetical protein